MPDPLYWDLDLRAVRNLDRLEVHASPSGPAGVSAVELADGSVWEVDHAEPDRLVGLDVDGTGDPTRSALLVAAFGGDGALFVTEGTGPGAATGDAVDRRTRRWGRARTWAVQSAPVEAGRLVLLADLADDEDLDPLARIAATAELVVAVRGEGPGADLISPLVPSMLDTAEVLAAGIEDVDLHVLDPKRRVRLGAVIRRAAQDGSTTRSGLVRLAERLDDALRSTRVERAGLVADAAFDLVEDSSIAALELRSAPRPSMSPGPDGIEVDRIAPGVAVITVMRSDQQRWVRVANSDGLVLLAQSRLDRDGLVDRAVVAVPDGVETGDLVVSVVDADELFGPTGPLDAVRAAVRAGRHAARASRLRNVAEQAERWERCAALWEAAGDADRARRAHDLAGPRSSRLSSRAPIADEIVARAASSR